MKTIYTFIFRLAIPFILLRLLWRSRRLPAYRHRWKERFAWFKSPEKPGGIWIHAVSFGESVAAIPLIKKLQKKYPDELITVTNMTPTGSEKIRGTFGDSVFNIYVPYDLPGIMRRFLKKVQPKIVVIIETELWPNMLCELKKRSIKLILANGRLSARSAANYAKVKRVTRNMLQSFTKILVQTEPEAQRYIALGAKPEDVIVTGSIKFDITIPQTVYQTAEQLKENFGKDRLSFIAASTHEGEEQFVIKAYKEAKEHIPDLILVLVPRHPDRFDKVAKLCVDSKLNIKRRSLQEVCDDSTDVYLGDTMGELLAFYAACDLTFVGGSLVPIGGHNVLEPGALAKAIIVGPYMENFLQIKDLLLKANGLRQILEPEDLGKTVVELLQLPSVRKQLGDNAEQVVQENKGSLEKHVKVICEEYGTR